ncbi:MAG: hypothetical protein LBK25_09535 [Treponema sp.]|nr:hypothetical protein [Treponema sp.]
MQAAPLFWDAGIVLVSDTRASRLPNGADAGVRHPRVLLELANSADAITAGFSTNRV